MRRRSILFLGILFLVIGFATVTTTLVISSKAMVSVNKEEFDVYFSKYSSGHANTCRPSLPYAAAPGYHTQHPSIANILLPSIRAWPHGFFLPHPFPLPNQKRILRSILLQYRFLQLLSPGINHPALCLLRHLQGVPKPNPPFQKQPERCLHRMHPCLHGNKRTLWHGFQLVRRHERPPHHLQTPRGFLSLAYRPGEHCLIP